MTTRERNLAVAVSAVLGVAAVAFVGWSFVLSPLLEKNKQIKAKSDEIRQVQNDIDDVLIAKRKYEAQRIQSLPGDPTQGVGVAREEYGRLLEGLCHRADLTGLKIIVAEPDNKSVPMLAAKKPAYTKLSWDVSAKGDLYHLVDFLRMFYSQPLLHSIKSMTVQRPADARSRDTRELDINLKVEALVLDNAQARPTLLPVVREIALLSGTAIYTEFNFAAIHSGRGAAVPPPGALADPPREYLAIAGKNMFFGSPKKETEREKPPEIDLSQFMVLTSIVGEDGTVVAMFRDQLHNYDYTITQTPKGTIYVKGEWEVNEKKKQIFGYDEKKPSQTLFYGSSEDGNYRAWRVRRVTANEVILEMADKATSEAARVKPPGLAFLGGAAGVFVDAPEGKVYSVGVGQCLETEPPKGDKPPLHPLATPFLLRREAFKAIYAPAPEATPVTGLAEDGRR
jgi:Tfp pilus assembly protein PilO